MSGRSHDRIAWGNDSYSCSHLCIHLPCSLTLLPSYRSREARIIHLPLDSYRFKVPGTRFISGQNCHTESSHQLTLACPNCAYPISYPDPAHHSQSTQLLWVPAQTHQFLFNFWALAPLWNGPTRTLPSWLPSPCNHLSKPSPPDTKVAQTPDQARIFLQLSKVLWWE